MYLMHFHEFVEVNKKSFFRVKDVVGADDPGAQTHQFRNGFVTPVGQTMHRCERPRSNLLEFK